MKRLIILTATLLLIMFILPVISIKGESIVDRRAKEVFMEQVSDRLELDPDAPVSTAPASKDSFVMVDVLIDDRVVTLPMDEYLYGVVAAEVPAAFPIEALKAQAVAARTYTAYKMNQTPPERHKGAHVCADYTHCKAYVAPAAAIESWGAAGIENMDKIRRTVAETDGKIVTHNGQTIIAVFHSTSSGHTEQAADVWGSDIAYLKSVASPGEEKSPRYFGRVELDKAEFKAAFLKLYPEANLAVDAKDWFANSKRSQAGGIITVEVGGVTVKGTQIRELCKLRSTNFTYKAEGETLVFETLGYGHGVGMSQYGARELALEGKGYADILKWYYVGCEIGEMSAIGNWQLTIDN